MFTVNRNPTPRDLQWFALGMLVGFPMVSMLLLYFSRAKSADGHATSVVTGLAIGLTTAGVLSGVIALALPHVGRKLYVLWMTLTVPIGLVMSTILLTVMYFVLLPVFSLIVRRQDPLRKKLGGPTYWEDYKPHEPSLERMRRPF